MKFCFLPNAVTYDHFFLRPITGSSVHLNRLFINTQLQGVPLSAFPVHAHGGFTPIFIEGDFQSLISSP
jgi:hypothetical protein